MSFEQKKIQLETLGEYLSEIRKNLGLTTEEVSVKTGLGIKFLEALEAGYFKKLPADVYVYGFLKQLANLYALDNQVLVAQFKKEKNIQLQLQKNSKKNLSWSSGIFRNLVITPKNLSLFLGLTFVFVSLFYIFWQVFSINNSPSLEVFQPIDKQVLSESYVEVVGKTEPGMTVNVNQQNVFVDGAGNFKTKISLTAGTQTIEVVAKNRFDKSTKKILSVLSESKQESVKTKVSLEIEATLDVSIKVSLDSRAQEIFELKTGETKKFTAEEKILLSSSNGGATLVKLNTKNIGKLGKEGEAVVDIPFLAEE